MNLVTKDFEAAAAFLWNARIHKKPGEPLTKTYPSISVDDAYQVSRKNYQRRILEGARPIGKKIGLTSRAVQKQLGVDQPDFGYLTSDMIIKDGGLLKRGSLIQGKAEGEVAFFLKKDLTSRDLKFEDIVSATDFVVVCIEVIDSRIQDWKIKIEDTIADNASSAFIVLGKEKKTLEQVDLKLAGMTLKKNGEIESTGVGAACMDHPINAVLWLAQTMVKLDDPLRAGDCILSGAYGPVVSFKEGDSCTVEINGLGFVSCSYEK